jgi:hypothetical protein
MRAYKAGREMSEHPSSFVWYNGNITNFFSGTPDKATIAIPEHDPMTLNQAQPRYCLAMCKQTPLSKLFFIPL